MTPRIIFYSQDGFGLGHLRRATALATHLGAVYPEAQLLTLADSPRADWFPVRDGNRVVQLPGLVRLGPDRWAARDQAPPAAVAARRRSSIERVVDGFGPDLLVVDHLPVGAMGELAPALDRLRAAGTRLVLGLRDILDAPAVVRAQWARDGSFDAVEGWYDAVLVYGQRDVLDVASAYGLSPASAAKVRYCGYVAPGRRTVTRRPFPSPRVVVVSGGGADAHALHAVAIDAVGRLHDGGVDCELVAVTGPFMPLVARRDLVRRAAALPAARVVNSVPDVPSLLARADLVVSRAGYNASVEACRSGAAAVLVPRPGPSQEQRLRAGTFAARRWVDAADPDGLDGATLAEAMARALQRRPAAGRGPDMGGLDRAVDHLRGLIGAPTTAGRR